MAKRKKEHYNMEEALQKFIKVNKLEKGMDRVNVKEAWVNLMGNGVNNYTTAVELRNETLFVSLSSSVLGKNSVMEKLG